VTSIEQLNDALGAVTLVLAKSALVAARLNARRSRAIAADDFGHTSRALDRARRECTIADWCALVTQR
jgi:hypothetical protein